jgi:TetR/AcrR family fatty acid metabolism transcriptional regulator
MNEGRETVRRKQIIQAAIEVFRQKGYHDAKIEEIALAAGIGKGTIYQYYRSKEELLDATLNHMMISFEKRFLDLVEHDTSFEEKMQTLIRISVEQINHIQPIIDLSMISLFAHFLLSQNTMKQYQKKWMERFSEFIDEGVALGQLRPVDPALFTLAVFGIIFNVCSPFNISEKLDKPALVEEIVALIMQGVSS